MAVPPKRTPRRAGSRGSQEPPEEAPLPAAPVPRAPVPSGAAPAPAAAAARHPFHGKTLAKCVVGDRIGRGATSSVFRARFAKLDKDVALKVLSGQRAADAELRSRFLGEAKAIARLDHENIVKVLDVVEDRGNLCILMELVDGDTVQDLLDDKGPLPPKRAVRVALDVARALEAAHAEEVVHRDIKPANFILDRKTDHVKVVDFGLAAKGANNRVGTPLYMSPEAAQGKRIDERSDVYALGVSLYQMLTGKHPFTGQSVKDILAAQVNQELVPVGRVRPDVGTKFDDLLARMLAKSKGYRPSAADVVDLLEPLADEPPGEGAARQRRPRRAAPRKSPVPMILSVAGVAVVLAVVLLLLAKSKSEEQERGEAPPPPPPVQVKDAATLAKEAFDRAQQYADSHPADHALQAKEWGAVEKDHAGTEWAGKAAEKRALAENAAEKLRLKKEQDAEEEKARQEEEVRRKQRHESLKQLLAALDFEGAERVSRGLGAPDGTANAEWVKKTSRIAYLGEKFLPRLNEALEGGRVRANRLDKSLSDDARIVGADKAGLVVDTNGTKSSIPWAKPARDDLYVYVLRKAFSQSRADDCLFLAIAAAELGIEQRYVKENIEGVRLLDDAGTVADQLKLYFVNPE